MTRIPTPILCRVLAVVIVVNLAATLALLVLVTGAR